MWFGAQPAFLWAGAFSSFSRPLNRTFALRRNMIYERRTTQTVRTAREMSDQKKKKNEAQGIRKKLD